MLRHILYTALLLLLGVSTQTHAMTFDNRFIPLIQHPYITAECKPSHYTMDFFVLTASKAFGNIDRDEVGIPELYGNYDERDVANGIVAIGCSNPLRTGLQGTELPWRMEGKIQGQGFAFSGRQELWCDWLTIGFSTFFMHVNSRQEFFFKNENYFFTPEEVLELDQVRRAMDKQLCLTGPNANQIGMGDTFLYLRAGRCWDYLYKFRTIEAGIRFGVIFPTGVRQDINSPASIPFGGNGFYGFFGELDAEFELKEDWKVGAWIWLSTRFPRIMQQRMPVNKEPYIFGPVVGPVKIDPGVTAAFLPYIEFENLREGLGARVQYTGSVHSADLWHDRRANKSVRVNVCDVEKRSQWASDYVTLTVFYDFGKVKNCRGFEPIVKVAWDVPVSLLVAHDVAKTHRILLGLEYLF